MKSKIVIFIVLAILLCGCVAGIGDTGKLEKPTIGQELIDLKKTLMRVLYLKRSTLN